MPVAVLFFKDFKAAVSSEEEKGRSDGREDIGKGSGGLDGRPLLKRPVKVLPFDRGAPSSVEIEIIFLVRLLRDVSEVIVGWA